MTKISYGDEVVKAQVGDIVSLQSLHNLEVVKCERTGVPMLNIDANQIKKGDLNFIKALGLTISNPDTDRPIALGVDYEDGSWGHRISQFLSSPSSDDDDGSFFSGSSFLGGSGSSGFSSFGGFGGGSFSGGGASSGF